jgi:hypothetical protein
MRTLTIAFLMIPPGNQSSPTKVGKQLMWPRVLGLTWIGNNAAIGAFIGLQFDGLMKQFTINELQPGLSPKLAVSHQPKYRSEKVRTVQE